MTNRTLISLFAAAVAAGCATDDTEPEAAEEATSSDSSESTDAGSESTGVEGPQPIALERAWVEGLEGSWSGPVDPTPIGRIPGFPLDFQWEADGSLHALTSGDGASFDFRFEQSGTTWVLTETGELDGFSQSYALHPIERDGQRVRWVVLEAPDFITLDITSAADQLTMRAALMGAEHAVFELSR